MSRLIAFAKKHYWKGAVILVVVGLGIFGLNYWIVRSAEARVYRHLGGLPSNNVGLVLGTSALTQSGHTNWHFKVRINAAAELYYAGKVKHLLLSGDNHRKDYDEPTEMKNALMRKGIPESTMTLDYAGFRTLDSVVRAREIFGQKRVTIVTEEFHAARSAFLAQHSGLEAVVYCSEGLSLRWNARSELREVGARVKAALDVYVFHLGPKFLGEKVPINLAANTR